MIFQIVWLAWYWNIENRTQLVKTPVIKWSVNDVQMWLKELGPWTEDSRILFEKTQTGMVGLVELIYI